MTIFPKDARGGEASVVVFGGPEELKLQGKQEQEQEKEATCEFCDGESIGRCVTCHKLLCEKHGAWHERVLFCPACSRVDIGF